MDIKVYFRTIREQAAKFDPDAAAKDLAEPDPLERTNLKRSQVAVPLLSVTNAEKGSYGGQFVWAAPMIAAEWIFMGTHRLATAEEIKAYEAEQVARRAEIQRQDAIMMAQKSGITLATLSQSLTGDR